MPRKRGRVGCQTFGSGTETPATPAQDTSGRKARVPLRPPRQQRNPNLLRSPEPVAGGFESQVHEQRMDEDTMTPTQTFQAQSRQIEGVAVVGEALRRVPPE